MRERFESVAIAFCETARQNLFKKGNLILARVKQLLGHLGVVGVFRRVLTPGRSRVGQGQPQGEDDRREQDVGGPLPDAGGPGEVERLLGGGGLLVGGGRRVAHLQTHHRLRRERLTRAHRRRAPLETQKNRGAVSFGAELGGGVAAAEAGVCRYGEGAVWWCEGGG